ncbi:hypothetical protein [Nostoc sp. LPT]|uniref:hypothetical protein n=1 Tax=Nostoc sp. LPT TaxID=2815387 RepID=UPI001DD7D323|nr:hypothetical protein [Nostoc sp. LPT]MBN4005587.1 hypothetical protein [Nostoc sp. LPT]
MLYYRKWHKQGVWQELNHTLRNQVREQMGRSVQPTALAKLAVGIAADSQSVKTTEKREPVRWAGKARLEATGVVSVRQ